LQQHVEKDDPDRIALKRFADLGEFHDLAFREMTRGDISEAARDLLFVIQPHPSPPLVRGGSSGATGFLLP
jgi:hypothetical protein